MAINVGTAYVEILPSTNRIAPGIRAALSGTEKDSKRAGEKSGKGFSGAFAGSMKGLVGLGLGTALAGFTAAAINTRSEFGKTMASVGAVSNLGAKDLKRLEKQAIDMGASTVFSANEAADAMLELAKAGIKPADIEAGALKGTLKLAAAAGTDMATAATIAGNAMNTFGLEGKQMNKVANALAGGANASTASVESLGEALSQVGPGAVNAGLDLNETVGVLAAFDSAGIKGSDAGTSLKTMLASLVPQTGKAEKAMRRLGLEFTNSDGSFKSVTEIAGQLQASLGGLSDSAKTQELNTLFGSDASRAASVLMKEGSDGIEGYIKATKDKKAADRAAEAGMTGLAGAIERVKGAWETFMLQYGGGLEKGAVKALGVVESIIGGLGPAMKVAGKALGLVVGAISSAVGFILKFKEEFALAGAVVLALYSPMIARMVLFNVQMGIAALRQTAYAAATKGAAVAQRLLNLAMKGNPIGLVIAAITLLVGAFVLLYKKNEGFRKLVNKVWGAVKTWIVDTWKKHLKPALTAFANWFTKTAVPAIKRFWSNVVKPIFAAIGKAIKAAWTKVIKPALSGLKNFISNVLIPVIKALWNRIVKPYFKFIGGAISGAWTRVIKPALSKLSSAVKKLPAAFRTAKDGIARAWNAIKSAVAKPVSFVIKTVWDNGLRKVINAIPGVKDMKPVGGIPGYAEGGWTGPGSKYQPAGVVHADEFVVSKGARRKFEKNNPGALDYLNKTGSLPGYAKGGRVVWPTTGRITSTYSGHDGVDINGPGQDYGNPIFAFRDGTISYVGSGRGYGAPAIFQRTAVGEVVYGHASSASVQAGQRVKAGQVIGRIGSTGNSSGPHLHFGFPGGSYGGALAALQGASTVHGGGSAPSKPTFFQNIKDALAGMRSAASGIKQIGKSGWAGLVRSGAGSMAHDVADAADGKLPGSPVNGLLKKLGVFDNGGVLEPGMLAFNASKKPEAVYNHKQFKQFAEAQTGAGSSRRMALTITNWKDGTGYFEEIAEGAVEGNARFTGQIGRMR